jgi:hypothetical protein
MLQYKSYVVISQIAEFYLSSVLGENREIPPIYWRRSSLQVPLSVSQRISSYDFHDY